ncbi:flagellar basal-body MS-ring/collar protein FliF [Halalkalibacterium halodurans]|uniref:Flagellar M-ring protein n=1 Tax=Halalkalibacterium halodurans TaxID=86665 RepID=A0A0M0KK38_ALKHA|nr:flagellar basal-body MS-ring/collar protein FliF [Halalkalibacterium halodurans]MED4081545.1 flagellar basal-body MS-ring/collar protein FliF [Halalkalibacterium halodurans]MED4086161.1 flagellar basal-body MS-ring/collar protein FliF [Halalkalibacterium halodurans]MED4106197.1 flagellar basal-body MS-ring/collar protein FliF [Halalkalibacterium halodurans]MED4108610.1 flagellar basal-body MS-ring/collar protein FliF [Halalkalibacterium halodurans]MED4124452.1 flagellar basal-body MS-ring/c
MNERVRLYRDRVTEYWRNRTKKQQMVIVGAVLLIIILLAFLTFFSTRTHYVPLYSNLTLQETGNIKETLDARGISSEIANDGTTILVPETQVDALKVELAAEGLPQSGTINYSTFRDSMGFGMTDNEFSLMERAAIESELADLIRSVDGVNQANVMITLPEQTLWVSDSQQEATASVVVDLAPGFQLDASQVRALYHLVSRSVPNLPIENIVIMNQMFEDYLYDDHHSTGSTLSVYEQQRAIQRDIERDLTRNLQQMLGTLVGRDKVLVSVTTDIDFTQENRQEERVEPVDEENMEGIAVSVENITETYNGEGTPEGGIEGVGDDIPNFPGVYGTGEVDYELTEDRINYEVNRIRSDIVESPYKIRDLGIQVMVEPPEGMEELPADRLADIQQILGTVVRTSISGVYAAELTDDEFNEKIFVSSQPFEGKADLETGARSSVPVWVYVVGGILLATIIFLIVLLVRRRGDSDEDLMDDDGALTEEIPDLPQEEEGTGAQKRKQIERMAKERPEEFSKLLRTWLSED